MRYLFYGIISCLFFILPITANESTRWPQINKYSQYLKNSTDLNTTFNGFLHKTYNEKQLKALNFLEQLLTPRNQNLPILEVLEILKNIEPDEFLAIKTLNDAQQLARHLELPEKTIMQCSIPVHFTRLEKQAQFLIDLREELAPKENKSNSTYDLVALITPQHSPWYRLYLLAMLERILEITQQQNNPEFIQQDITEIINQQNTAHKNDLKNLIKLAKMLLLPPVIIWYLATNELTNWLSQELLTALYSPKLKKKIARAKKNLYSENTTYKIEPINGPIDIAEKIMLEAFAKSCLTYIPKQKIDVLSQLYQVLVYLVTGKTFQDDYGIQLIKKLNAKAPDGTMIPLEIEDEE